MQAIVRPALPLWLLTVHSVSLASSLTPLLRFAVSLVLQATSKWLLPEPAQLVILRVKPAQVELRQTVPLVLL